MANRKTTPNTNAVTINGVRRTYKSVADALRALDRRVTASIRRTGQTPMVVVQIG